MATLCKQMLLNKQKPMAARSNAKNTNLKTTGFCLAASQQLAARLGGAASLVDAQSVASHGRALADRKLSSKLAAIKKVVDSTCSEVAETSEQVLQIHARNSTLNAETKPVDPAVSDLAYKVTATALRRAQAATLGIAEVTEESAPSPLAAKDNMLDQIYLAAQKQNVLAKIERPYLVMLNQVKV